MKPVAAALLLCAIGMIAAGPARADVLIDNVAGLTPDEHGGIKTFNAVLIGDDGRIAEVFDRKDKRPKTVDYRIDGQGRVMVPGLIDSQANVMELGLAQLKAKAGFQGDPQGGPRPEDRDAAFDEAQTLLLAAGFTSVVDMGTTIEDWQSYRRAGDRGALRIRLIAYAEGVADMALIGGPRPTPWLYDGHLRQVGVVLTLDGPLETRQAWLKAPYADGAGGTGKPAISDVQLKNLMSRGAIDNFQVAVRANGDAAVAALLDALDQLAETYIGDRRWRIEGADVLDEPDVARIAERGAIASMQPQRLGIESAVAGDLLGPGRLAEVQCWRSIEAAGATLAFGSGSRGEAPRPFAAMALAVTRRVEGDQGFGGWQPQEALSRDAALAAFTSGAAEAIFAQDRLGRIARGKAADFLFIDRDPLTATPEELARTRVLETWIGGVKVFDTDTSGDKSLGQKAIESYRGR